MASGAGQGQAVLMRIVGAHLGPVQVRVAPGGPKLQTGHVSGKADRLAKPPLMPPWKEGREIAQPQALAVAGPRGLVAVELPTMVEPVGAESVALLAGGWRGFPGVL